MEPVFKGIVRAEAIGLFGAERVHDAEVYALSREPDRTLAVTFQARQRDPLDSSRVLTWLFSATPEMLDKANRAAHRTAPPDDGEYLWP